ncbi:hypothetical protein FRB91_007279 [Serendipita sp. 411]|nr:hypothetical protein FRC16_003921 [Serendipita sp. 398]KAG8823322.1 hypothetical protein FRC19_004206 [Serendipita sp. 401]KAG8837209.1 hypothetical protein FRC18_009835 [Serendipita sp. 400]KAG8859625.1 hypothetical protein FRB91_007279 [Serendipita sp. 411]KAG9055100.1 hypothetical protein FS842_003142 [Serendipita sp. 407]
MGRRKGTAQNISVVAPRLGSSSAPDSLVKAVSSLAKKENRVFQEQQPFSSAELQSMEDASNWNGLLINARGERGPQWDVTSQLHHVPYGSEEYFNPTLLEDRPDILPEDQNIEATAPKEPAQISAAPALDSQDVTMAEATSPTRIYPQNPSGGMRREHSISQSPNYPPYGQPMNLSQGNSIAEPLGHGQMYPVHMQQHPPHPIQARAGPDMGAGGLPSQYAGAPIDIMRHPQSLPPQQHPQLGGLSYNNMVANQMVPQNPVAGMNAMNMGMTYGGPPPPQGMYPPNMQGEHPGSNPQYGRAPGGGPMTGAYGGIY